MCDAGVHSGTDLEHELEVDKKAPCTLRTNYCPTCLASFFPPLLPLFSLGKTIDKTHCLGYLKF